MKIYIYYPYPNRIYTNTTERAYIKLKKQCVTFGAVELSEDDAKNRIANGAELIKISDMM